MSLRSSGPLSADGHIYEARSKRSDRDTKIALEKERGGSLGCADDVKGIDLKPREGFEADYFKIKDEIVLVTVQPGAVMRNFFATFVLQNF